MQFPLSFLDISLFLAVIAIILLVTSELLSPYYGKRRILISKQRLKNVSLIVGILFIVTVIIRVYEIVISI